MLFDDIRKTLEEYFEDNWVDNLSQPLTPIAWQNSPFENEAEQWVRFGIQFASSANASLGGARVITPGFISVQIFVKADAGAGDALVLADKVAEIFQNKTLSGIFTYATSVETVGEAIRKINKIEYGEYQIVSKTRFEAT